MLDKPSCALFKASIPASIAIPKDQAKRESESSLKEEPSTGIRMAKARGAEPNQPRNKPHKSKKTLPTITKTPPRNRVRFPCHGSPNPKMSMGSVWVDSAIPPKTVINREMIKMAPTNSKAGHQIMARKPRYSFCKLA